MLTISAIRSKGVFVIGVRRLADSIPRKCILCRMRRAPTQTQLMADLPPERLTEAAALTHIGIDSFGPFYVTDGKTTRRNASSKKVFALMITCFSSRAVHLEPMEGMDTSSFMLALRRFLALRGPVKSIHSDHGSNFIGAIGQSDDFRVLRQSVEEKGIEWTLKPVGASHFGGVYERKIDYEQRVLEAHMLPLTTPINRAELYTMFQEAASVVNSTPLYPSPGGEGDPLAISPSMLLTLKTPESSRVPEPLDERDLLAYGKRRWRRVQHLADCF